MKEAIKPKEIQHLFLENTTVKFPDQLFNAVEFDSRSISDPQQTLFVALKGQNIDGHKYINKLIQKGVKNFIIEDINYLSNDANFFVAEDGVSGFQALAYYIRKSYKGKVIAITGSNGKTIVKEWLGQLLSIKYTVCKSPKSFNSQIGVAFSLCQLKKEDFALEFKLT